LCQAFALRSLPTGRPRSWGNTDIVDLMKKPRVIIRSLSKHRIYIEYSGGQNTLYAVTDKLKEAKALVLKAKRELGIARGSKKIGRLVSDQT
jgi:hypothetical protein